MKRLMICLIATLTVTEANVFTEFVNSLLSTDEGVEDVYSYVPEKR